MQALTTPRRPESAIGALDLTEAFHRPPGYHGACWVDLCSPALVDRQIPRPLRRFLFEVRAMAADAELKERHGVAYFRVIDGAHAHNDLAWHIDNNPCGVRFQTAISTDGAPVNLAWLEDRDHIGQPVADTYEQARYWQPDNGVIVCFRRQPHGVLPQPERPGELTVVFFATLYPTRADADLYTTHCHGVDSGDHAILPTLEATR